MRPPLLSYAPYAAAVAAAAACAAPPPAPPSAPAPPPSWAAPVSAPTASPDASTAALPLAGASVVAMATIPGATFKPGSSDGKADEKATAPVNLPTFRIDTTEVTVAAYAECVAQGSCVPAPTRASLPDAPPADRSADDAFCNGNRPDRQTHPANCVDWSMADAYCRWAGKRLPTEVEWEYAARGPDAHTFPWGEAAPTSEVLNACGDECVEAMRARGQSLKGLFRGTDHWPYTAPVARYPPGPFGLYDMAGNVWEWTASPYCPYDAKGCADTRRVARGGSWRVVDWTYVRSSEREPFKPATRSTEIGFRCAR